MPRKSFLLILLSFYSSIVQLGAVTIDGNDSDWLSEATVESSIPKDSSAVLSDGTEKEWIWRDNESDQSAASKPDLTELSIKSDGTNLYFLARFNNLQLGTADYVTPMVQIAIDFADGGKDTFWDASSAMNEKISENAYWEYLVSLYQPGAFETSSSTGYVSAVNDGTALYKSLSGGVQPGREGTLAVYRDTSTNEGFIEAGISYTKLGSADSYKNGIIYITAAVFENAGAFGGNPGDSTVSGIIEALTVYDLESEKEDERIDVFTGVKFDSAAKIAENTAPQKVDTADIKIDGRDSNSEVIVNGRTPVISWAFADPDASDTQMAIGVQVSAEGPSFTTVYSSFSRLVDSDVFNINYPESARALQSGRAYHMRLRTMDLAGAYGPWSDALAFATTSSAAEISNAAVDLTVDWNNPFHSGEITKIRYTVPPGFDEEVFLAVYTTSGRLVKVFVDNEIKLAGVVYTESWDGKDSGGSMVGSGIYIVHLRIADTYKSEKVCFVR